MVTKRNNKPKPPPVFKKRGKPDAYTVQQVIDAINEKKGLVSLAAQHLKCSLRTVYNYATKYPEVKQTIADNLEYRLDVAEDRLSNLIDMGDLGAICFFLKTRGKSRGYIERQEVTGSDGGTIQTELKIQVVSTAARNLTEQIIKGKGTE